MSHEIKNNILFLRSANVLTQFNFYLFRIQYKFEICKIYLKKLFILYFFIEFIIWIMYAYRLVYMDRKLKI